jgi:hypothetical protein
LPGSRQEAGWFSTAERRSSPREIESLCPLLHRYAREFSYEEIDPDVFGEELDRSAYAEADRIAVVGLTAIKQE